PAPGAVSEHDSNVAGSPATSYPSRMGRERPETAAEVFASANWETLLPRLRRAARCWVRLLGYVDTETRCTAALDGCLLVNETVKRFLAGERTWVQGMGATEDTLVRHLSKAMYSVAIDIRTSGDVALRAESDGIELHRDESPTPSRRAASRQALTRLEQ